jgi:hypothetical protein
MQYEEMFEIISKKLKKSKEFHKNNLPDNIVSILKSNKGVVSTENALVIFEYLEEIADENDIPMIIQVLDQTEDYLLSAKSLAILQRINSSKAIAGLEFFIEGRRASRKTDTREIRQEAKFHIAMLGGSCEWEQDTQDVFCRRIHSKTKIDTASIWLKAGADVNKRSRDGVTPLYKAISSERLDLIELLIEKGAKINEAYLKSDTKLTKETHLIYAINRGLLSVVELLCQKGADVNKAIDQYSEKEIFGILKRTGGTKEDFSILKSVANNGSGSSPLIVARSNRNKAMEKLLLHFGAK